MILYFSGCGNSRHMAELLGDQIGESVKEMDVNEHSPKISVSTGEGLGFVCPIYAWRVPHVVSDYINRLAIEGDPNYCYLVCTYGDSAGVADRYFRKLLVGKGLTMDACWGIAMPETYINLPGFNLDTPEDERTKIAVAEQRIETIAREVKSNKKSTDLIRSSLPGLKSGLINRLFYRFLITDKKFRTTQDCIHCGQCAAHCPLANISMENGLPRWHGHCTNCMSCYHRCPSNAIQFGKATEKKGQYYYGHAVASQKNQGAYDTRD